MTNKRLINQVTKYVVELLEAEHITETTEAIRKRVEKWYNHTDFADFETLVAAAWIGEYDPSITMANIEDAKDCLFLERYIPVEYTELHIKEIEEALNDEVWRF